MSATQYSYSTYRRQIERAISSADDLWARANQLRSQGRHAEADRLEAQAERIDNRHANTNYSSWLNRQ